MPVRIQLTTLAQLSTSLTLGSVIFFLVHRFVYLNPNVCFSYVSQTLMGSADAESLNKLVEHIKRTFNVPILALHVCTCNAF